MSRFREFPGTFAGILGLLALLPLYDHPLHAAGTALAVAAVAYGVMRTWFPPPREPLQRR
jgi:hypothetical protein